MGSTALMTISRVSIRFCLEHSFLMLQSVNPDVSPGIIQGLSFSALVPSHNQFRTHSCSKRTGPSLYLGIIFVRWNYKGVLSVLSVVGNGKTITVMVARGWDGMEVCVSACPLSVFAESKRRRVMAECWCVHTLGLFVYLVEYHLYVNLDSMMPCLKCHVAFSEGYGNRGKGKGRSGNWQKMKVKLRVANM